MSWWAVHQKGTTGGNGLAAALKASKQRTLRNCAAWISSFGMAPPNRASISAWLICCATSDDMLAPVGAAAAARSEELAAKADAEAEGPGAEPA